MQIDTPADKIINLNNLNESNLIIPFHYSGKHEEFSKYMKGQGFKKSSKNEQSDYVWLRNQKKVNRYLASHIDNLIDNQSCDSICFSYHLNMTYYENLKLPAPNNKIFMKSSVLLGNEKDEEFTFYLYKVSLYYFKTGIGFLVFNIKHEEDESIDSIADKAFSLTRFYTKEKEGAARSKDSLHFRYKIFDSETKKIVDQTFSLSKVVNSLLNINKSLEDKITLFPSSHKKECNIFHRILINQKPSDEVLKAQLYLLRRAYHSSFYTNKADAEVNDVTDLIYQTQHNNYFSFCQRGLVCLYYPQTDRDLFNSHFKNNVRSHYFFIYLFLLHERNALFYYNTDIMLCRTKPSELIRIKKKLINFRIDYSYKVISDESTYQNFYNHIKKAFSLEELNAEVQDIIDRATEHQKNVHDNSTNTALALLALFGILSAFDSGFSVIDRLSNPDLAFSWIHIILTIVIGVIICVATTIYIVLKKKR